VIVSQARRLELFFIAALAAAVLTVGCGGGKDSDQGDSSSGSDRETSSQLSPGDLGIELDTTLETAYYPVEGTTTETIFSHIEHNGPTDGEGKRGSGLTSVVWGYEWQGGPEVGACGIRSMTIKAEMVVTLPQHANPDSLPAGIRGDWDAYAQSVAVHEQTHVDIYEDGADSIRERMLAIGSKRTCDELEAEIKLVWDEEQASINARQAEFHQLEFDRLAQQRAPIAAQIDANRVEINRLEGEIRTLDGVVVALRNELDSLSAELDGVDDQIKAVNESNESSQDKQAKLVVLVQQRNALQARHNSAVDEHNAALAQREPLVTQRDQLINETNQLVDEFNWTR